MSNRTLRPFALAAWVVAASVTAPAVQAQDADPKVILFTNVNVFDGINEALIENANVVVTDNLITAVSTEPLMVAGGRVIDGGGRTMIPGLIDVHWHSTYCCVSQNVLFTGDMSEVAIRGALGAESTLLRGFTTVRDMGGNPFSIKKMIDGGDILGPRILPSGPPMSQTSGHFDYRALQAVPSNPADPLDYWNRNGLLMLADGVPEVTKRTREILRMGATQIKIAGGGGVSSVFDPLDVQEYTFEEMKAVVDVAETWNTYVAAHIFTDKATRTALEAGVKSIEHGNLLSRETIELMAEKGAWLSVQPLIDDEDAFTFNNPASAAKWIEATDGTDRVIPLAKEIGVKMAFGTDMLFDPATAAKQGKFLAKMTRWFTPYEALKMATSDNAELLMLAGPRHPYQEGALGVIAEGAYADLILVDGNPLEDLGLVADPNANFDVIMKNGVIYKNSLD
ncbi:metal-dependent hydrolase family protein [Ruegeria aquimaris]|uniref:Amidohydrolase family protein n=1 Tax=Ruegeria aquimaris TaxID=2984333 RepID=A0ABT3ALB5_9RHOB|nr:amidohydrolase family protein [Ruegeria sp. XHP0148]MCV2889458.1 amidohydrolase family protein [Ruegeria sp. XHP0148]